VNSAEEPLTGRNMAVQSTRYLVQLVANLDFFLAVGLEIFEDGGVNHVVTVAARHLELYLTE
jgi:hypothetical protein